MARSQQPAVGVNTEETTVSASASEADGDDDAQLSRNDDLLLPLERHPASTHPVASDVTHAGNDGHESTDARNPVTDGACTAATDASVTASPVLLDQPGQHCLPSIPFV